MKRRSVAFVWLSFVDLVVFVALWAVVTIEDAAHRQVSLGLHVGYWVTAVLGFYFAVDGFIKLAKPQGQSIRYPVVCVLFAMAPASAALIGVLYHIGSGPVGQ